MEDCKKRDFWFLYAIIGLMVFVSGSAWGASLAELQDQAVANRKIVEKYRLDLQKGELDEKIIKGRFLPSLDLNYTANQLDEDGAFEQSENSAMTGSVSYNIFSGFKDTYDLKSVELVRQSKDYELGAIVQDIRYAVVASYLNIFGRKNQLTVAEDEYKLLQKRYEDSQDQYQVGLIRKNDVLKIKVELDNAEQQLKTAETELMKSVNQIAYDTNSQVSLSSLVFSEFSQLPKVKDFGFYEARMSERRNEIKTLGMLLAAQENAVKSARAAYYPRVDVSGSYKQYGNNYALGQGDEDENEMRLQLQVNMNLFDGFSKDHVLSKAELDVKRIQHDLRELKQSLGTELKNTLLDYAVSEKNLKVAESSILQAEENFRITDVSFKEGVETTADVLDAIFYLSRAKYNVINARNKLFLDYYRLLRITDDL